MQTFLFVVGNLFFSFFQILHSVMSPNYFKTDFIHYEISVIKLIQHPSYTLTFVVLQR